MPETQAIPKGLPPGKYLHQIRALPMHFRQELDGFYRQMQPPFRWSRCRPRTRAASSISI